ncbi:MAG: polyprenyl synthetase family protein [Thermoanaerobaculia bacterium]
MSLPVAVVPEVLAEYGGLTHRELTRYLPDREPRRHLYEPLSDYPLRGGKRLRPSLCIATARAFGAALDDALLSAAAIELFHNALLIHDDIEDGSEERRGRPTMHRLHGVPIAINAGDTLTLMSLRPLMDNRARLGPRLSLRILEETERMARESAEGQALELGWRRDNVLDLGEDDYLRMILKKTCWLLAIHPMRVGASIAGVGERRLDDFVRFGFFLGAAFQIQDDLLNLTGEREEYGKEPWGDLWEGKRTLMLLHLHRHAGPAERRRLTTILDRPREEQTAEDIRWVRERMDLLGSIEHARHVAHGLAGAALHEYSLLFGSLPDSRDKRFVAELVRYMLERPR